MTYHDHQLSGLTPYSEWRPTGFDSRGLGCPELQAWQVCPVILTRDAGLVDRANWEAFTSEMERVDPDGESHEVHGFNHWACGYFDIILVKPDTPAHRLARELATGLEEHPLVCDATYSRLQNEGIEEYWDGLAMQERVELCKAHGLSIFAARYGIPSDEVWDDLRDSLS